MATRSFWVCAAGDGVRESAQGIVEPQNDPRFGAVDVPVEDADIDQEITCHGPAVAFVIVIRGKAARVGSGHGIVPNKPIQIAVPGLVADRILLDPALLRRAEVALAEVIQADHVVIPAALEIIPPGKLTNVAHPIKWASITGNCCPVGLQHDESPIRVIHVALYDLPRRVHQGRHVPVRILLHVQPAKALAAGVLVAQHQRGHIHRAPQILDRHHAASPFFQHLACRRIVQIGRGAAVGFGDAPAQRVVTVRGQQPVA